MTLATLIAHPTSLARPRALRAVLGAALKMLRIPQWAQWLERLAAGAGPGQHRLGAWDLARSGLAREQLAQMRPRATIHARHGLRHG